MRRFLWAMIPVLVAGAGCSTAPVAGTMDRHDKKRYSRDDERGYPRKPPAKFDPNRGFEDPEPEYDDEPPPPPRKKPTSRPAADDFYEPPPPPPPPRSRPIPPPLPPSDERDFN